VVGCCLLLLVMKTGQEGVGFSVYLANPLTQKNSPYKMEIGILR
jgi:hypothetical protein